MPFVLMDDLEEREPIPGCKARFVHSENMTLAYWDIDAGAAVPEHRHVHEQICNVLEGRFELTVGREARLLEPGSIAVIAPNIPHSGRAITRCRIIDAFSPVREDYR
jgi:quercetin dioxygenase-like cupin family protein